MVMVFLPHITISTGEWNESFETILYKKKCCICIPTFDMPDKVVGNGTIHGSQCDKFEHFSLSKTKASIVKAPTISNYLVAIKCSLDDYVEEHGLLIYKYIQLWENQEKEDRRLIHANGDGTFFVDGEFRNRCDRMSRWGQAELNVYKSYSKYKHNNNCTSMITNIKKGADCSGSQFFTEKLREAV